MKTKEIKRNIYSAFSDIASTIGYSDMHGRIIAALLVNNKRLSLQELANETGYSLSTISLSLDFLELMGMIKKVKNVGDRKLYVELQGDLLEGLKKAFVLNLQKNITGTLEAFGGYKDILSSSKDDESKSALKVLNTLEGEIKRLEKYINLLSKLRLP
jgi:DNA-binding transcriptional regulator GbsR (MarR family)